MNKLISAALFSMLFVVNYCYAVDSKDGALALFGDRETKLFDGIIVYGDLRVTLNDDIEWGGSDSEVGLYVKNDGDSLFSIINMLPKRVFVDDAFKIESDCKGAIKSGEGCSFTFNGSLLPIESILSGSRVEVSYYANGRHNRKNIKPWSKILPFNPSFDFSADFNLKLKNVDSEYIEIVDVYLVEGLVKFNARVDAIKDKILLQCVIPEGDGFIPPSVGEEGEEFEVLIPAVQTGKDKMPMRTLIVIYNHENATRRFTEYLYFADSNHIGGSEPNMDPNDLFIKITPDNGDVKVEAEVDTVNIENTTMDIETTANPNVSDELAGNIQQEEMIVDGEGRYILLPSWLKVPDWMNYKVVVGGG